ncbi:MAG: hypothetical protein IH886_03405 [Nitrospinae bacterium]|nr:hypothetical protein [Nitrospinota bacterium]
MQRSGNFFIPLFFTFLLIFAQTSFVSAQTWTKLLPSGGPPAVRALHSSVYDSATQRMIMFGGSSGSSAGSQVGDLWVLEDANGSAGTPHWTQLFPSGGPSARVFHSAIYDSVNNRMTIFGGNVNVGFCNATVNDVWVLKNANGLGGPPTWTELNPTGDPINGLPARRHSTSTVYDPSTNRMIMTAGNGACLPPASGEAPENSEVWVLENANGLGGTPSWTLLNPTGSSPPARGEGRAIYDIANNRMIISGGCGPTGCPLGDVWVLENANGLGGTPNWIELFPTGVNPLTRNSSVVYEPAENQMVLFAGADSGGLSNDVWVLENANGLSGTPNWKLLNPSPDPSSLSLPAPRGGHSAVLDATSKQVTFFGGQIEGPCCAQKNDVWVLDLSSGGTPTPVANAGPDQTVDEGIAVFLDGTGSSDPQNDPLNYDWSQVAGPTVTLTGANTATPSFTAPFVSSNQTLTFELMVDDDTNFSGPDTVDVTVVNVNSPPIADAGDDSTIKEGATATLDGNESFDAEDDLITYEWTQVSGPTVTLTPDGTVANPTFTAPLGVGTVLVFKLVVSDGQEPSIPSLGTDSSLGDTVAITVVANSAPVADAGPDQTRDEGSVVTLQGSGSDSDGGDVLSFQWTQIGGTSVVLSSSSSPTPTFDAPAVGAGGEALTFQLKVTDNDPVNPLSGQDTVVINIRNINAPPSCNLAVASPEKLWPPNHKMKPVDIDGVMDTDDVEFNDVTLQITTVTQDEPVNGLGDGDTSPDAVIQVSDPRDSVLIRAERSGNENGRVYQINFTASDGFESCIGSVQVTVPHSRKSIAVDDGQTTDSTLP